MRPTSVLSGSSYKQGAFVRHVDEDDIGILVRDNKNGAVYVQYNGPRGTVGFPATPAYCPLVYCAPSRGPTSQQRTQGVRGERAFCTGVRVPERQAPASGEGLPAALWRLKSSLEEVVGGLADGPAKQLHKQCSTLLATLDRVAKDHGTADTLLTELHKIPPTTDAQMEEEQCEVDCLEFRLQRMKKRTQADRDAVKAQIASHKQRLATMLRECRERQRLSRDLAAYTHLPKVAKALGVPQTPMCEEVSNREVH
ncbi:hypothetical protein KIPB_008309 [Kipferlia bialata]|uniref:Uncharacterized protein n=1 Tax=Kipferlia bialata TaxID=797122 RepID=A0A9K3CZS3_9EUKA|nr:hypothetical protein KIPB_008309 [Kipferlia bialata]|eukprot:g8309.t1